jgi:hypothetical protein
MSSKRPGEADGNSRTAPRRLRSDSRAAQAIQLRLRGMSYSQIAEALKWKTPYGAQYAVEALLAKSRNADIKAIRALHEQRLDLLLQQAMTMAMSQIGLQPQPRQNEPPDAFAQRLAEWRGDRQFVLNAIGKVLEIEDQRAKVLGTYAPKDVRIGGGDTPVRVQAYDYGQAIQALAPLDCDEADYNLVDTPLLTSPMDDADLDVEDEDGDPDTD